MKTWRPTSRLRRAVTVAAVACLATTAAAALTAAPAVATTCTPGTAVLCPVSLTVSNNAANVSSDASDKNTATYTWAFTTGAATAANTLSSITFTVPASTVGTALAASTILGLPGCTVGDAGATTPGTVSMVAGSGTVTLTFDQNSSSASVCGAVPLNTPAVVQITGFTNPTVATTTAFMTTVTTQSAPSTTIATGQDTTGVNFTDNSTTVNVFIPVSLTFQNLGPSAITLAPIPGGDPVDAPTVTLKVATNATSGYTLGACVLSPGISGTGSPASSVKIPQGTPAAGSTYFGAAAVVTGGSPAGSLTFGGWAAGITLPTLVGYPTACGTSATAGDGTVVDNGPTSGDTIVVTNAASASATQSAGNYQGTITYVATPHY